MDIFQLGISPEFVVMLIRLAICLVATWIIVDRLYYAKSHRRDFYFTFMLISVAIFFIVFYMIFVLEDLKAKTSIGIGIGLFGIFSIMRYRTDAMPVREMTYLFVVIALSVVNAIANSVSVLELLLTNAIFILCIYVCEKRLRQEPCKLVQYDRIELVAPARRQELVDDLKARLGLDITHVVVGSVDLLRDMAIVKVYYRDGAQKENDEAVNAKMKLNRDDYVRSDE